MFDAGDKIVSDNVSSFFSESSVTHSAVGLLQEAGMKILQVTPSVINFSGSPKQFKEAFETDIVVEQREVIKEEAKEDLAEFLECPETDMPGYVSTRGTAFHDVLEGVALEEPRYFMSASSFAPTKEYWHLRVPGDVSLGCNADRAHRTAVTGKGVKVAMVDSGWFKHPFFVNRGYRAAPVVLGPGASNPLKDESGHGTGESANVFAVAPDAELLPVKINFVNSNGAFNAAVGLKPDIITCSWGSSKRFPHQLSAADQVLASSIATAVASGITVIFSAGNGHWGFPGQHPDVISAGGTFMHPDESLEASDYSSGFTSNIYANRLVPDVCGLVGMRPRAIYIMLPLEPGDNIDVGNSGGTHPNGDETAKNDGWAAFSGTSAAAPQLAGAAALIKQACPRLGPAAIRDILRKTARDVTKGKCHPNTGANSAKAGVDEATGHGLVDAHKATLLAKIRCVGPVIGPQPIGPQPIRPEPIIGPQPIRPEPIIGPQPIRPEPVVGPQPIRPEPVVGPQPIRPEPIRPPIRNIERAQDEASAGANQLSAEDVSAIEDMIIKGDLDFGS